MSLGPVGIIAAGLSKLDEKCVINCDCVPAYIDKTIPYKPTFNTGDCIKEKDFINSFGDIHKGKIRVKIIENNNAQYKIAGIYENNVLTESFPVNHSYIDENFSVIKCPELTNE